MGAKELEKNRREAALWAGRAGSAVADDNDEVSFALDMILLPLFSQCCLNTGVMVNSHPYTFKTTTRNSNFGSELCAEPKQTVGVTRNVHRLLNTDVFTTAHNYLCCLYRNSVACPICPRRFNTDAGLPDSVWKIYQNIVDETHATPP